MNSTREETVNRARDQWIGRLIDLSRRNRLLYFRDLKAGSLDLTSVAETLVPSLIRGESVRFSDLFSEEEQRGAVARLLEVRRKAVENLEEKGLDTMHLGLGIASWAATDGGRPPAAPVCLLPVAVELKGRDGLASGLRRVGDLRLNPVLLHVFEAEYGITVPTDESLPAVDEDEGANTVDWRGALTRVSTCAAGVPGFAIDRRVVLGNFSFQKMAMVEDLKKYGAELASHDLIAALAGDEDARSSISESRHECDPRTLDSIPVANDTLILDADSSQQAVVAAAVEGQDGVVQGPPGTGKSQTIANAIAAFVAEGKKVLFVAEKRAALEVVTRRLQACGLGHIFLDLHGADIRRSMVATRLAECLRAVRESPAVDGTDADVKLEARRKALNDHVLRMHSPRTPSGRSAYRIQGELLQLPKESRVATRWKGKELEELTAVRIDGGLELLREAAATPGLFLRTDPSPWNGARITSESELQAALELTDRLADAAWPQFTSLLEAAAREAGLPKPTSLPGARNLLKLIGDAQRLLADYSEGLFSLDLTALQGSLEPASRGAFGSFVAWCVNPTFRGAIHQIGLVRRPGKGTWAESLDAAKRASNVLGRWKEAVSGAATPRIISSYLDATRAAAKLVQELTELQAILAPKGIPEMDLEPLGTLLLALRKDRTTPYLLPNLYRIERELDRLGLKDLVAEFRSVRPRPEVWGNALTFAWLSSCMDAARAADPVLAAFNGRLHDQNVEDFQGLDEARLDLATLRVRRFHAERAVATMNEYRAQEGVVRREANKKTRHLPVRHLLAQAPEVMLSLCPCWMASPLSVSHLLDGKRQYFDIVIFDEASQVPPEDAIPSILRGQKTIVAGDRHQLPPTTFFDSDADDDSEQESEDPTVGFESVLDIMTAFLQPWSLDWHYRSRDERLIAFSNRWIYGNRLITFPGVGSTDAISYVPVSPGVTNDPDSSSAEVQEVVRLVLAHAQSRPDESLGVITMGLKHALRIEKEIWRVRQTRPDLDEFFDETKEERFFVKNLERVQGDERDAIILSIGYAKDVTGRLLNRFGPLNFVGGERRLNVAITRARERMAVVSSFGHADMDPSRFGAQGVKLLKDYLEYAASRGHELRNSGPTGMPLNGFEADVFDTLSEHGLRLIPQWGASRYRIDMVVQHPAEPGRFVLAIECDGASYHSAYTARDRDRLRQQQLEAQGWKFHRIWSTDWFLRKDDEVKRALAAYEGALSPRAAGDHLQVPPRETVTPVLAVGRRSARPQITVRPSITDYRLNELVSLVRWISSDGVPLTDDQILAEMIDTLGFKRRGARIESAIRAAIEAQRRLH